MSQWGFVEGQVVRGRNFDVGITNLQKLLSDKRFKGVSMEVGMEKAEVLKDY